ncbi:hypothetical protein GCM10007939_14700 [Amylibacter marinus]|uniref:Glycosyl transferases group 1 n=1 Tax=Amylibacter marinus TaxID=1475483 RepID=A0ABQ5VUS3_9RHOB|nr:hypothetical protein GCM10007939_14700 [Amylibacter marinus]
MRILSLSQETPLETPKGIEEVVIRPDCGSYIWRLLSQQTPLAPVVAPMSIARINRHIEEFTPDVIFFEETITTGFIDQLRMGGAKTVLNSQNVDFQLLRERGVSDSKTLEAAKAQEIAAINNTDMLISCSDRDAKIFENLTGKSANVLENPIPDQRAFDIPITPERYRKSGFLFVGMMSYSPNARAAEVIGNSILPKLAPDVRASLVGRHANTLPKNLQENARIDIHSDVPSILDYLADFGQTLMPIASGGGTRLKVLEAMAAGVCLVASAKAVEGIDLIPNTHFALAETPAEFARAFQANIENPHESAQRAITARQFVFDTYSEQIFEQRLKVCIDAILDQRAPA